MSSIDFLLVTLILIASASRSHQNCSPIEPPENGFVRISHNRYYFSCEDGYMRQGQFSFRCEVYDKERRTKCVKPTGPCKKPPPPENGAVECNEDLTPGKSCRFWCFEGYQLNDAMYTYCMPDGTMSESVKCDPIPATGPCQKPPPPENGAVECDEDLTPGKACRFRCFEGYILNDAIRAYCRSDGTMSETARCDPIRENHYYDEFEDVQSEKSFEKSLYKTTNLPISHSIIKYPNPPPPTYAKPSNDNPCLDRQCEQLCLIDNGVSQCKCCAGFTLNSDNRTCKENSRHRINMNECLRQHKKVGDVEIRPCLEGYTFDYATKDCIEKSRQLLRPISSFQSCSENNEGCQHDCVETDSQTLMCQCQNGYELLPDGKHCIDINECSINNSDCSHSCVNLKGSAYCDCPSGFALDTDNKTCIDINECSNNNFGCSQTCINLPGSAYCVCAKGFMLDTDNKTCVDIDECSENNGGCEQCINYRGGFYCACKTGHRLLNTLKNCLDIQCLKLPLPHYSHMECNNQNLTLPEGNIYPAGTKCSFTCSKGFKNAKDDNIMKCQKDGTWTGTLPVCKPQSCPPLKVPENGEIHPASCSEHGAKVKQKFTFGCHAGYILEGFPFFTCKNNLIWSKESMPACKPVKIQPVIKCPENIEVTLLRGKSRHNITVPEPTTNVVYYEIHPSWVTVNEPVEFHAGTTRVTFTANSTAECEMTVELLDKEPPVFQFCPDSIKIEGAKGSGKLVTWDEPVVTDNVQTLVVHSPSFHKRNTTILPGEYLVEYLAMDSSENIAKCSFNISIFRLNCNDLRDPSHGKANCMDNLSGNFGRFCYPFCDKGYARLYPENPMFYNCDDDDGVWKPSDTISDCLPYTLATSSSCQDGFEFIEVGGSKTKICIACPSNAVWSPTTRKCEK